MKLIGFTGRMGVGKSTAIDCLYGELPYREIELIKFAQPLYDMQEMIYRRITQVYKRPSNFTKDRKLLQWLGTDWGRDTISQSLWVDLWKADVKNYNNECPKGVVVCDDVRFDNEAEALKSLGGTIIKISSSHSDNRINTKSGISNHASEAGISPRFIDLTVENNGSRLEFMKQMTSIYKDLEVLPNNKRSK